MFTCEPALKKSRAILAGRRGFPAAQCGRASIAVFTGIFVFAALMLALRRLSGALVHPLPIAMLIPAGCFPGIATLGIRTLKRRCPEASVSARGDLIINIALGASLLIFAAALSLPGTNAWGLGCFWALIVFSEIWAWGPSAGQWLRRLRRKDSAAEKFRIDPPQAVAAPIGPVATLPAFVPDSLVAPVWPAKGVTQQLTRSSTARGGDMLCGTLRLDLLAGQRTGNLHVAFCPPFAATPEITAVQVDGPQARIKIAQLLPYGVRMDLRLVAPNDQSASVLVQITARLEREH